MKRYDMKTLCILISVLGFSASAAYSAHPLITDDTGTQGKGKGQLEFTGEYSRNDADGVLTESLVVPTVPFLSYGLTDRTDLVLGISYQHLETRTSERKDKAAGSSDISIELKHRFFEKEGLGLALKSGITLPVGDHRKRLGTGRATYRLFFLATKELNPWALHLNLGYIRHENRVDERKDLWHVSAACWLGVTDGLRAVANIGMERNPDKSSGKHPAFVLAGFIYSITENFDLDFGIKRGLNKPESDYAILAGIAWRFKG